MEPINTRAAWRPLLKPIGRFLVAAHLALALQPLSVLAQAAAQQPADPVAQAQMQRIAQWSQRVEAAKARQQPSPADTVSEKLAQAQEIAAQLKSGRVTNRAENHQQLKALLRDANAGARRTCAPNLRPRARGCSARTCLPRSWPATTKPSDNSNSAPRNSLRSKRVKSTRTIRQPNSISSSGATRPRSGTCPRPGNLPWQPQGRAAHAGGNQHSMVPETHARSKGAARPRRRHHHHRRRCASAFRPSQARRRRTRTWPKPTTGSLQQQSRPRPRSWATTPSISTTGFATTSSGYPPGAASRARTARSTPCSLRGNAFDTASLTIALLRASGIPARDKFGTIDVPCSQVMNWIGGVQRPEAALNLLYQGGIAAAGSPAAGASQRSAWSTSGSMPM